MSYISEAFKKIGEIELSNQPWEFNIVAVWEKEGKFYLGTDSGCSCPIPFEHYTDDDLTGPLTHTEAIEEIKSLVETVGYGEPDDPEYLIRAILGAAWDAA